MSPKDIDHVALRLCAWIALAGWIVLALARPTPLQAAPPLQSVGEGETLFQEKCVACHTIGGGVLVGPDLAGVVERRDQAWLSKWILAPDKMLAAKDPIATQLLAEANNVPMPNLGLNETQVASLIAYLENPGAQAVATPGVALAPGDPTHGRALFTGASRLQNGGPPCMNCHSIAGLGALGGGALGPDLTAAINRYGGDKGLAAFLNTLPTVTMNAVWTRQPLSPAEQDDLRAFMRDAAVAQRPPDAVWLLAVASAIGLALFLLLTRTVWRRRLVSVRRELVQRSRI